MSSPAETQDNNPAPARKKGTIMLVSGEYDKALLAFEIATGFQSMGMDIEMWFVIYGVNCLRKPQSRFSLNKWFGKLKSGQGRQTHTDHALQYFIRGLNPEGANHIPTSQLNFGGLGPAIFRAIMRRKGMAQLEAMILNAEELGIKFNICQVCVDAMAYSVPDDLIVKAEVKGVSSYYMDVSKSDYDVII